MKYTDGAAKSHHVRRSPYGERGLKCVRLVFALFPPLSLSLRRAWIEIDRTPRQRFRPRRRSPYGERGLKFEEAPHGTYPLGRSPYGERGLKLRQGVRGTLRDQRRSPYGERGLKY